MPPIFGILNTESQKPDPEAVSRMRGVAHYIKPRKIFEKEVRGAFMAAAVVIENPLVPAIDTIAVLDSWIIVADANLYKRKELLERIGEVRDRETGREGEGQNRRRNDTELILKAWLKWGKECIQYLYGDFAFVIFNHTTGELFCGRDPLGVRPLFYAFEKDVFVFGSELRCVLSFFRTKPVLRHDYLLDTLVAVKTKKELSPFENIFRLKPGHYLHQTEGDPQLLQYWQVDPEKRIQFSKEEDFVELFREKLVNAVDMRCAGTTVLGSELSGGLDSSVVTSIASDFASHINLSFSSFSNVFPLNTGLAFKDEREFIAGMVDYKSFPWIGVERLGCTIPDLLQYTIDIQGCFVQQNFNVFNRGIYERAGKLGMQLLLSGFGGDELVSARISMPWNELIDEHQWKVITAELFYNKISVKSLLKPGFIAARYLKSLLYHPKYRSGVFTPELLDRRFANLPLKPAFAASYALRKRMADNYRKLWREKVSMSQFDRIMLDHLPQRMEYCYAAAGQFGMEYRYPLLDVDLMETCLAFPPWIKQHHGINRYIFRQAIKGYVPEEIRQRNDKSGTTIPQIHYSLLSEKELIIGLIDSCSDSSYLNEIFDFSRFPRWYEKLVRRDKADMNYLMPGAFYNYLMIMLYFIKYG